MPEMTYEYRLQKVEQRVAENEDKNTSGHKHFYDLETEYRILASDVKNKFNSYDEDIKSLKECQMDYNIFKTKIDDRYLSLETTMLSIANDIKELKEKPIKKWDGLTKIIMTAVVTGIISFLFGSMSIL